MADAQAQVPPIVSLDDLPGGAVLVDVRWSLAEPDGRAAFAAGHLPGARYLDLEAVGAGEPGPIVGRHPLPTPEVFAAGLGAAGIREDDVVVAYDDANGMAAARLVVLLRVLGYRAAVLDGGLGAFDGELATGEVAVEPVTRSVRPWPTDRFVEADEVARHAEGGVVADSRAADRYAGAPNPLDPRPGHVPGAISLPFTENYGADGRYLPAEQLRARFEAAGVDTDAVFYCGSGVSACVNLLAAEQAGLGLPRLYVASWSGWASDPDRPVEVS